MRMLFGCVVLFLLTTPLAGFAQDTPRDGIWSAEVREVSPLPARLVPGTEVMTQVQMLTVEITEGPFEGRVVEFENDFIPLEEGDRFFINYLRTERGDELFSVREPDRRGVLWVLALVFAAAVLILARGTGLRSLLSLALSFVLIIFVLLPLLLAGYPPLLTALGVSILILGLSMALTHGLKRETLAAFLGSGVGILATGILAYFVTVAAKLSGYSADESVYLNLSTGGTLDMQGILLGAIMIGVIGVLDDIAMTQASAVDELTEASGRSISPRELYARAMRIGREHVCAVVNTLALAYAGASLPLLLLFSLSDSPATLLLNQEVFAVEIIRTIVGSIGLILAVPATTYLAILLSKKHTKRD